MTIQPGEEIEPGTRPGQLPESLKIIDGVSEWEAEFRQGVTGRLESAADVADATAPMARLVVSGAGDVLLRSPEPRPLPPDASAAHLWVHLADPCELDNLPELLLLFSDGEERSLGQLDFSGWHLLHRSVSATPGSLEGLILRGLFSRDEQELLIGGVGFETGHALPLDPIAVDTSAVYQEPLSMLPHSDEEVTTSVFKDEISFVFEARSLTAVVRYVYTPIEGNLSDIEVEINNAESVKIAESGGVTIEMGNRDWAADDEEVERHFVSCEQVGDTVEARWQWRRGDELADFLYRLSIAGKSLVVDIDGGNGKATGVDLGYTAGAIHPRLIRVPYFSFGDEDPLILCTSGVFISSLLDWYESSASSFFGPPADNAHQELRLNGGCRYEPASDDKRNLLRERWILTVSRSFEEVLPSLPQPTTRAVWEPLRDLVWYNIPHLETSEEAYVKTYEQLRAFKQRGLDNVLVNHPADTWRDGASGSSLSLAGAHTKGGDDALIEYLEAVRDLGFQYTLCTTLRDVTPTDPQWTQDAVARQSDGSYTRTGPGRYLLKPAEAIRIAPAHARTLADKYSTDATFLTEHTASPPWDRVDFDSRVLERASFRATLLAEQSALVQTADAAGGAVIGEGGNHWLYAGLLPGYSARLKGSAPCRQPLLVDFDLKRLHPLQVDAGIGEPSEFFGENVASDDMHSRSGWFDRYLAATVAFGHAGCLPDVDTWGMPAVVKAYCMTQRLQTSYLGIAATSILYHHDGQLLETSEALVSGAYERSQVQITYANGLQVHVNGSWSEEWEIEDGGITYKLPPASFHARGPDELLVYSADSGSGRIDFVQCDDYFYCDTRGQTLEMGPLSVNGAALVRQQEWAIDVFPVDCQDAISIEPGKLWPERRMPKLRVLGFRDEDDDPQVISANLSDSTVVIDPAEGVYKYRITLPEWMVEPGTVSAVARAPARPDTSPLLTACSGGVPPTRPVWFMRQAGRILKPYRDLKDKNSGSIRDLFEAPELAAEITLMPVDLLGVDAAILFADIFTPVMPMGCDVEFSPGPQLASPIRSERQVESLRTIEPQSDLPHVLETIALVKRELEPSVPLIGFAGAPFTLATYMVEGAGAREFTQFRRMVQTAPHTAHALLAKLTDSTIAYLSAQIKAGAQAIQLFDTCVGALPEAAFATVALPYLQQIFASLGHFNVPRIYYANGASHLHAHLVQIGADVLSLDWRAELAAVFHRSEGVLAVQGNLDPIVLFGSPEHIESHARDLLTSTDGIPHVFNLGHGVHPETPFDSVKMLVDIVHEYESPT